MKYHIKTLRKTRLKRQKRELVFERLRPQRVQANLHCAFLLYFPNVSDGSSRNLKLKGIENFPLKIKIKE
jgi:hypothetical protein